MPAAAAVLAYLAWNALAIVGAVLMLSPGPGHRAAGLLILVLCVHIAIGRLRAFY
jgi:hypothetical protein